MVCISSSVLYYYDKKRTAVSLKILLLDALGYFGNFFEASFTAASFSGGSVKNVCIQICAAMVSSRVSRVQSRKGSLYVHTKECVTPVESVRCITI